MATRNPLITQPFALAGDVTIPPVPAQSNGSVSFNQGWPADYQADPNTDPDAKPVERLVMNALFNILTANLLQYQREGSPEFIAAADNGGVAVQYPVGAVVMWRTGSDPFKAYLNTLNNNTNIPSHLSWLDLSSTVGGALLRSGGTMVGPLNAQTPVAGNRSTLVATTQMFASEFTNNTSSNGWQRLPSGLILQWGQSTQNITAGVASANVLFPIAFPNFTLAIQLCHLGADQTVNMIVDQTSFGNLGFFRWKSTFSGNQTASWFAIGV